MNARVPTQEEHAAAVAAMATIEQHINALEVLARQVDAYPAQGTGLFWGGLTTMRMYLAEVVHDVQQATPEAVRAREVMRLQIVADGLERRLNAAQEDAKRARGVKKPAAEALAEKIRTDWMASLSAVSSARDT